MIPRTEFPTLCVFWEDPDLLVTQVTTDDKIDEPSIRGMLETFAAVQARTDEYFWLFDLGNAKGVTTGARHAARTAAVVWKSNGMVIVGGSLAIRAVVTLIARGLIVLGRLKAELVNCKTEQEARAWIAARRSELKGSKTS